MLSAYLIEDMTKTIVQYECDGNKYFLVVYFFLAQISSGDALYIFFVFIFHNKLL